MAIEGRQDRILSCMRERVETGNLPKANGEVFQVIKNKVQPTIKVVDLSKQKVGQDQLWKIIRNEIYKLFNLEKDLLIRVKLINTGQRDGIIILVVHNMVWDSPSVQLLMDEWAELYNSYLKKRSSHLPSLSIQFKDYTNWEQLVKYNREREKQKNYWLEKLKGDLPLPLRFPLTRTFGRQSSLADNTEVLIIEDKKILGKIKTICRQVKATPFMFVLALLDIFLFKVTGKRDLIVGTSVTLRNSSKLNKLIGPFFSNLALRNKLLPRQNFLDILKTAKKTTLEALANRRYTFSELAKEKGIIRNTDHPLLNVFLDQIARRDRIKKFKKIEFNFIWDSFEKITLDLKLSIKESSLDKRLLLRFSYNPHLFSRKKMKEFSQNFEEILGQVIHNPYIKIDDLKMIKKQQ